MFSKFARLFFINLERHIIQPARNNRFYSANSFGRHLYHKDVEQALNEQISAEFNAMYAYLSMACYFGRNDIALPGCYGFFMNMHQEEHDHALMFINYQNLRGGEVVLKKIELESCVDWGCILNAFSASVKMEQFVKEKLICVNQIAEKHKDHSTVDFITSYFIPEQERSISEMSRLHKRCNKMGSDGVAEYLFDKEIYSAYVKKAPKPYRPDLPDGNKTDTRKDVYV
ncbi:hypothetical protein FQA39_LY00555 [Lamprigera yunnana]|nr:hypothetical protein FQA39_LY00555 [Lamprigera yunnana]